MVLCHNIPIYRNVHIIKSYQPVSVNTQSIVTNTYSLTLNREQLFQRVYIQHVRLLTKQTHTEVDDALHLAHSV